MRFERYGQNTRVEINKDQYVSIVKSMDIVLNIMYLEEKFDNLLENFQDLQEALLSTASRYMVFRDANYLKLAEQRSSISRRVSNLLSTGRQYHDQSLHFMSLIFGRQSKEFGQAKARRASLKPDCWQYEFIDALRNHVQHFGLPFHSITVGTRVIQQKPLKIYDTVAIFIEPSELTNDQGFDDLLIQNVGMYKGKIDLMPLIRNYLECIGALHMDFRNLLSEVQKHSVQLIEDSIREFQQSLKVEHPPDYYFVVQLTEDAEVIDERTIFNPPIERLAILQKKNSGLRRLSNSYVSGESPQDLITNVA